MGDVKSSKTRGHYAQGGEAEDFNPIEAIGTGIGELGDALSKGFGDLFGGNEQPSPKVVAPPKVVASDEEAPTTPRRRSSTMSPISDALITAGLGMMASPHRSPLRAIGQGGLLGMQAYNTALEEQRKRQDLQDQLTADENFAKKLGGFGSLTPSTVASDGETPKAQPATEKTEAATPSATPAGSGSKTDRSITDLINDHMKKIQWLNSQAPRSANQKDIVKRAIDNEQFEVERLEKQREEERRQIEEARKTEESSPAYKFRTEQEKAQSEALSKNYIKTQEDAKKADEKLLLLDRMKEGVKSGKFYTGAGGDIALDAKKILLGVGLPLDEENIALAEQFQKDASGMITAATNGSLGNGISNADVLLLGKMQPGLGTTQKGNVIALDAAIKIEKRKKEIAQFQREYMQKHNGILDQNYDQALYDWSHAHSIFDDGSSSKSTSSSAPKSSTGGYTPEERAQAAEILRRRREGKQ